MCLMDGRRGQLPSHLLTSMKSTQTDMSVKIQKKGRRRDPQHGKYKFFGLDKIRNIGTEKRKKENDMH